MVIDDKEYVDKVLEACEMTNRVIGSLVGSNDPEFKDLEKNDNSDKMKWILFEDILHRIQKTEKQQQ